jgi:hypothetical protein
MDPSFLSWFYHNGRQPPFHQVRMDASSSQASPSIRWVFTLWWRLPGLASCHDASLYLLIGVGLLLLQTWWPHWRLSLSCKSSSLIERGSCCHGLSGWSVLHQRWGCEGSGWSPRVMPPRREEAEAPLPTWRHEELLGGVLNHGPLWGWCPTVSWAHEGGVWVTPPRGEAQDAELVGDELEAPKANSFTDGEATTHQAFTVDSDGDHRWGNHQNV